ncbi:MAG TPA: DUF4249 domain-containing protein [Bacteroidales bacterium]|nr:DUF4249 domain-containing protein [Bacteroidales bacterium]
MNIPIKSKSPFVVYIIFFILLITACESDLKLDIHDSVPLLTVNCILKVDESVKMLLTENQLLQNPSDSSHLIRNASVHLIEDDAFLDSLVYKEYKFNGQITSAYVSSKDYKPLAGHSYQIKVVVPAYKSITSSTVIPQPVQIISIDTISVYLKNGSYTYKVLECTVRFKDPTPGKNYYKLSIDRFGLFKICQSGPFGCTTHLIKYNASFICYDNNTVYRRIDHNSPGPISLENENEEIWFDELFIADDVFNGNIYELKVYIRPDWFSDWAYPPAGENITYRTAYIRLYSVNEEYYKYSKSYFNHLFMKNDLFSEPVQVYSNILNGTGIFSGASVSIDSSIIIPVRYNPQFN